MYRSSEGYSHPFGEPRLGTFLPNHLGPNQLPPLQSTSSSNIESSPIKHVISRPGGMNISSLLNDAPSNDDQRMTAMDAASDGTVSERDAEGGIKRSPQSLPTVAFPPMRERGPSFGSYDRPEMDRYRASSAPRPYAYDPTLQPAWRGRQDGPSSQSYHPPRPATVAPTLPPITNRPSWNPNLNPPPIPHSHSQPISHDHPPLGVFNPPNLHRPQSSTATYERPQGPGHEWRYPTQTYAAAVGSGKLGGGSTSASTGGTTLPPINRISPRAAQGVVMEDVQRPTQDGGQ
jgi:hypothetical protein